MKFVLKPVRIGKRVTLLLFDEAGERLPGQRDVVYDDQGEVTVKFAVDGDRIRLELPEVAEED